LISEIKTPIFKVYTKIDLPSKITFPERDDLIKISSMNKNGFDLLISKIKENLPT
jgi:tRNA U34 5-carboxymethylaminomethyl modifying GTPase MnmE/TrmE